MCVYLKRVPWGLSEIERLILYISMRILYLFVSIQKLNYAVSTPEEFPQSQSGYEKLAQTLLLDIFLNRTESK